MKVEIPNAIDYKHMLLGGRPTVEQYRELAAQGFRKVIDLRAISEEGVQKDREIVVRNGMESVNIEIAGVADLRRDVIAEIDRAIGNTPTVLHCASGNRVGAALALRAFWIEGMSGKEALELGIKTGLTQLGPVVEQLMNPASGEVIET